MQITLNRKSFLSAIKQAITAVPNKSSLPIQECFLMELKDGVLSITADDNETRIKTQCEVIESNGNITFCPAAKSLVSAIDSITDETIVLDITGDMYSIIYKKGKFEYPVSSSDSFPMPKISEQVFEADIDASDLMDAISKAKDCTADDELRPVMNGVFIQFQGSDFVAVASDGHKLMAVSSNGTYPTDVVASENHFILAQRPAIKLNSLLRNESDVSVKVYNSNVIFSGSGWQFTARLIEGRFPNWRSVIPRNNPFKVEIKKKDLSDAIKRVSLTASEASSLLKVSLHSDLMGSKLTLSATDMDFKKSSKEEIDCTYTGEDMSIGLKGTNMQQLINDCDTNDVVIELSDASLPIIIRQKEKDSMLALLMPMMLND